MLIFTGADISAQSITVTTQGPVVWILLLLLALNLALVIGALISITKSSHRTPGVKVVWFLFVVEAPFLGSLLWFILGRARVPRRLERGR